LDGLFKRTGFVYEQADVKTVFNHPVSSMKMHSERIPHSLSHDLEALDRLQGSSIAIHMNKTPKSSFSSFFSS
jgi:hypothetical protein